MVCIKIQLFQLTFSKCFSCEGTFRAFIPLQVSLGKSQTVYSFNIIKNCTQSSGLYKNSLVSIDILKVF